MAEQELATVGPRAEEVAIHFDKDRMQQMLLMAAQLQRAGCFGKDVQNAEQAFVKIQAGFEMGIPPIESVNSLYIVNGVISIWGKAMSKRMRQKGWTIKYEDREDAQGNAVGCKVTVTKGSETHSYDAKSSELTKSQAFKFAPKNKLRWHALGQLIRFEIPEVLDAGVAYLKEELDDSEPGYEPAKVQDVTNVFGALMTELKNAETLEAIDVIKRDLIAVSSTLTEDERNEIKAVLKEKATKFKKAAPKKEKVEEKQPEEPKVTDAPAAKIIDPEVENFTEDPGASRQSEPEVKPEPEPDVFKPAPKKEKTAVSPSGIRDKIKALQTYQECIDYKAVLDEMYELGEITNVVYKNSLTILSTHAGEVKELGNQENQPE